MIFYGTKGAHLKSEKISGAKCTHCGEQTSHTVSIFGRYAYLYWIPVFPLTKKGVAECNNCKATVEPKEMSEQLRLKFDNVMRNTKTPITYWVGSLILIAIILFAFYSIKQHEKDAINYIANPQKGDVIEYKPSEFYSTLRIENITADSIFVIQNNYEIERQSKLYKIDKDKNYTTEPFSISKKEFQKMFDDKTFLDIDR